MKLALYKGAGRLFDKAIRTWTQSPYSHCELVTDDGLFLSSSPRDGGVRAKRQEVDSSKWDFIPLPYTDQSEIIKKFYKECGKEYDWKGIIGTQIFHLGIQSDTKWFCSEICAYLLGYDNPSQYSPGDLALRVLHDNNSIL
jgi:hypothetical protein